MEAQTEMAIRSMVKMDASITGERLEAALAILKGQAPAAPEPAATTEPARKEPACEEPEIPRVLKCADAVKYLHISRRTLDNYFARGYLRKIYGANGRALGVDLASYRVFVRGMKEPRPLEGVVAG